MDPIDALVDDYLRAIVQSRPWTKRREEAALTRLVEWAHAQHAGNVDLRRNGEMVLERCLVDLALSGRAGERFRHAIRNFLRWVQDQGQRSPPSGGP